ncbi:hypothetical protein A0H81_02429 [Grifola frondosa]|uniref:Uncharacterized protein n=1 Tax=Grifola frondosa TaxID=5627 RepID=A0A1C7MNG8_GRIFR|nr:hypothetical protein A0H81_02429 [Grifola frondosa]
MTAQHASHNWWAQQPTWGAPYAPSRAVAVYRNPYKRVPNPVSAEYWSTKLLDNPLGLENMYISLDSASAVEPSARSWEPGEPESSSSAQVHTPWIWTPRELARPESETTSKRRRVRLATPAPPNLLAQHYSYPLAL